MRRVISITAATGAVTAAALAGIAGCASSTTSTTSSRIITSTGATSTGTGSTGTGSTTGTLTLPQASCGSAVTHVLSASTQLLRADPGALTCFTTAARACKAAGLHVIVMGVDTGTRWVFAITSGGVPGRCAVTAYSQHYSATNIGGLFSKSPGGWVQAVTSVTCQETAVTSKGVTLECPGQAIMIPATVSAVPLAPGNHPPTA